MSNASLKEQLQAVASQLSDKLVKEHKPKFKKRLNPAQNKAAQTKVAPAKVKPKWLEYVQYGVELLRVYFPACFKSMNEIQPLKKGIKQDLIKQLSSIETIVTEDKACMVKSLAYYVNTAAYHKSVVEGATRVDLNGQPAGIVTAEEAKYSIERQQAKIQAKKSASITEGKNNINIT